jgi:hypothetical protein
LEFSRCLSPEEDCYGTCMEGYKKCNSNTDLNICRPMEECNNLEDEEKSTTIPPLLPATSTRAGLTTGKIPSDNQICTNPERPCKGFVWFFWCSYQLVKLGWNSPSARRVITWKSDS